MAITATINTAQCPYQSKAASVKALHIGRHCSQLPLDLATGLLLVPDLAEILALTLITAGLQTQIQAIGSVDCSSLQQEQHGQL